VGFFKKPKLAMSSEPLPVGIASEVTDPLKSRKRS
jgi:hypothetical protein